MKKILLVISLISVLLLTGCNKNENVDNVNISENTDNQVQEILENNQEISQENPSNGEKDYKLSDKYDIDDSDLDKIEYNIPMIYDEYLYSDGGDLEAKQEELNLNPYKLESDGASVEIVGGGEFVYITVDDNKYTVPRNSMWCNVGVLDFDTHDNKKELVLVGGEHASKTQVTIYELNNNGPKMIFDGNGSLIHIKNKYIIPVQFGGITSLLKENLFFGYYAYDNGEIKFVDRFLNGEKMYDENNEFNENFQKEIWTVAENGFTEAGLGMSIVENGQGTMKSLHEDGKIRFIRKVDFTGSRPQGQNSNGVAYEVEVVETASYYDNQNDNKGTYPAGTHLVIVD